MNFTVQSTKTTLLCGIVYSRCLQRRSFAERKATLSRNAELAVRCWSRSLFAKTLFRGAKGDPIPARYRLGRSSLFAKTLFRGAKGDPIPECRTHGTLLVAFRSAKERLCKQR